MADLTATETPAEPTPFHDLQAYLDLPRVAGLTLSPDGTRLVATVSVLSADRKRYVSSLWLVDPEGARPATRLTRSDKGESGAAFRPDGSLLFVSARPHPEKPDGDQEPSVWLLPADGGEARRVLSRAGGVSAVRVARATGDVVVSAPVLPGARDGDDAELRKARKEHGVSAVLHTGFPVRYWDHDLGPAEPHLLHVGDRSDRSDRADGADAGWSGLSDLTPEPGRALDETTFELTPDGGAAVTGWQVLRGPGELRGQVRVVDVRDGGTRVLLADEDDTFEHPRVSPDGRWVVARREGWPTMDEPADQTLVLVPFAGGEPRDLLPDLDQWPAPAVWSPGGDAVYTTVDDRGRGRVLRVDLDSGAVTVLTGDDGAYSSLCPSPDGRWLYAVRASVDEPPTPVRLDAREKDQVPTRLPGPGERPRLPGTLTEVETAAADGHPLRAWLALPDGAGPDRQAPLLLWVHGGPQASWNQWQWRWNPWLMVAHGYAVLLPDPALSTGYGLDFHRRGWGAWGDRPYTDLMAVTDAVAGRPDVDADRTAAMGGSFGGYMANWIAGQTDRFRAIVTHASLWALDQFSATTDMPAYWQAQFGDPATQPARYEQHSPHLNAHRIRTPMLVIHGDRDYRVPIGEGLRLYWQLVKSGVEAQFLYFPDENHWVLAPGNVVAWYETVLAFLRTHVLGESWQRPPRL